MKVAVTGGGTGGHLAIAKAIAQELARRGHSPIYIGSQKGQDREWFEGDDTFEATYFLPSSGVVNKRGLAKIATLIAIMRQALQAKKIFAKHSIEAIFSVGGYSAAPASIAALLANRPLYIHEQNAHMGTLNKLLAPFAKRLFTSFAPPYDPYPVRDVFFAKRRIRDRVRTVIFLGGSQGALQINEIAMDLAPKLADRGIRIIHQTGKRDYERMRTFYEERGIPAECFAFDPDLVEKIAAADLAISRAGASTLWELAANALPAVFVPYPHAAGNHQYYNAKFLVDQDAGWLYEDADIESIIQKGVAPQSQKLAGLATSGGAAAIVEEMLFKR